MRNVFGRLSRRSVALAVAVVALAAVGVGVALAAIPSNGQINGCFLKSGGTLRVIDTTVTTCKAGEQSLSWNVQGAPGAKGDTGAPGAPGAPGPAGTARAYAFVNADGSLAPGAVGIATVRPVNNVYCVKFTFTPTAVVATGDTPAADILMTTFFHSTVCAADEVLVSALDIRQDSVLQNDFSLMAN